MIRSLSASARCALETLVRLLFPPLCYSCGVLLPPRCHAVCPECHRAIERVLPSEPLFMVANERLCADRSMDALVTVFRFTQGGELERLLHQLKYGNAPGIGVWLGQQVGGILASDGECRGIDCILPMPLHPVKQRERGYNQSGMIARGISETVGARICTGILRRIRHTASQTRLGHDARRANVEGAFAVVPGRIHDIAGRCVLLVDDVITTGATMRSCARVLRSAGASRIVAASAAIADLDRLRGGNLPLSDLV
jgi:competence protein ComFC